jgi:hypothetical protein
VRIALFTFAPTDSATIIGAALVCPSARYASICWRGAERLDRCFATPADWQAIEREITSLPSGPLPRDWAIVRVLARDRGFEVRYLQIEDLEAPAPAELVRVLDNRLREQPLVSILGNGSREVK